MLCSIFGMLHAVFTAIFLSFQVFSHKCQVYFFWDQSSVDMTEPKNALKREIKIIRELKHSFMKKKVLYSYAEIKGHSEKT